VGATNHGFRFVLELCMLAAVGYWGFAAHDGALRWLLGLGTPLAVAVAWGLVMSPKATWPTRDPVRLPLEVALFGSGVAALAAAGRERWALALGIAVAIHLALTFALDQRPGRAAGAPAPPSRSRRGP